MVSVRWRSAVTYHFIGPSQWTDGTCQSDISATGRMHRRGRRSDIGSMNLKWEERSNRRMLMCPCRANSTHLTMTVIVIGWNKAGVSQKIVVSMNRSCCSTWLSMRVSRIASRRIHIYNTLEISDVSGVINFLVVDVTKIALSLSPAFVVSVCLSFFL